MNGRLPGSTGFALSQRSTPSPGTVREYRCGLAGLHELVRDSNSNLKGGSLPVLHGALLESSKKLMGNASCVSGRGLCSINESLEKFGVNQHGYKKKTADIQPARRKSEENNGPA